MKQEFYMVNIEKGVQLFESHSFYMRLKLSKVDEFRQT